MGVLNKQKGATKFEVLAVAALVAIFVFVAGPTMIRALNSSKEKVSLSRARTAYLAYEIKSSTVTDKITGVGKWEILEYIGDIEDTRKAQFWLCFDEEDSNKVNGFYYRDNAMSNGVYVHVTTDTRKAVITKEAPNPDNTYEIKDVTED